MHILRFFSSHRHARRICRRVRPGSGAESYDSCLGFIDALPATITTQGTGVCGKNLDTSATSGNAIEIQTNNVTIDCNGFRMRGSGAALHDGDGIFAAGRLNITIRHCTIRGFSVGIQVTGEAAISSRTICSTKRLSHHNRRRRRQRHPPQHRHQQRRRARKQRRYGIYADGDVIDNVVDGAAGLTAW